MPDSHQTASNENKTNIRMGVLSRIFLVLFMPDPRPPDPGPQTGLLKHFRRFWAIRLCLWYPVLVPNCGCSFGCIFIFLKVLYVFISFNCFSFDFNGSNWFKLLFGPIRLEIHKVSAQMVDSRSSPNRGIFLKLAHGLLGWGTTLRELKVPSGIAPLKKKLSLQTAAAKLHA